MTLASDLAALSAVLDDALRDGRPETVFGADPVREYRRLAHLCHPDQNGGSAVAHDAFLRLGELWQLAEQLRSLGRYGERVVYVKTKTRRYAFLGKTDRDDVADRYAVRWTDGRGYARVARKPRDNDLIRAEASVLKIFATSDRFDGRYAQFVPALVESVGVRQSGGVIRQANVFRVEPGDWYSLQQVIHRYPLGVDPRDMAWIWRRLLTVLGAAHRAGAIHGAVTPGNVMIEPHLHGLILTNWSYSVPRGGIVPAVERAYRDWYAPEILAREPAGRGSDVYLAARSMIALGGGWTDVYGNASTWPRTLRAFFRACFLDRARRPRDAWELLGDFDDVLERTYGPNRFRPFPPMNTQPKGGTTV